MLSSDRAILRKKAKERSYWGSNPGSRYSDEQDVSKTNVLTTTLYNPHFLCITPLQYIKYNLPSIFFVFRTVLNNASVISIKSKQGSNYR